MLKKINKIHLVVIILIIILLSGILPTNIDWSFLSIPFVKSSSSFAPLQNYQHPPVPVIKSTTHPQLLALSYTVVDVATNTTIVSKNQSNRIFPASTTKLATVLTALNSYPLDEVITIKEPYLEGKIMELQPGEKITVRSLVSALLVFSANDAAHALANHYSGGYGKFVSAMNDLMAKYQLTGTHFINVDGLHDLNHYSTAYDLAQLGRLAIKNQIVRDTVGQKELTVTDIGGSISHPLVSTNELLGVVPEVRGLKTGWTPEAEGSFIGLLNIDGHELISVVTASADRFGDTKILIEWLKQNLTFQDYSNETIVSDTADK